MTTPPARNTPTGASAVGGGHSRRRRAANGLDPVAESYAAALVVAGMTVNVWDVADNIAERDRAKKTVDPDRLADASVELTAR